MAKLILSLDGQLIKEYTLSKERTTLGRKPHNDIQIDNLAVSGEHAIIMTILNDSFLEDLGSTNGTLVNGQPVKKHFLQSNDTIEIGKYKLKYVNEVAANMSQAEFEKTMVLRAPAGAAPKQEARSPTDTQTNLEGQLRQAEDVVNPLAAVGTATLPPVPSAALAKLATPPPPPAAPGQGIGVIQILSGPNAGKELPLAKPLTTLGKPGVQVAVIAKRPHGYFITHVEGANFPVVNGKTLDAQARQLGDHDIV
ncbi:MAG: FHA domain-containing protein, partial [Betaproteobacteria bacterium]